MRKVLTSATARSSAFSYLTHPLSLRRFPRALGVHLLGLLELRENLLLFRLRPPAAVRFRHLAQFVDPDDEIFGRLAAANFLIAHINSNRVADRLRIR